MTSLMTLPRELRDQICTYVLFAATNKPPALDQSFPQLIKSRCQYERPRLKSWSSLVLSAPEDVLSNSINLLLINHQLQAETLQNITLIGKTASYSLDIIILDEILPLTTWTCVPFLTTDLEEVNVSFRISGCYDRNQEIEEGGGLYLPFESYKRFRYAGPAQIYSILERFIKCGPTRERTSECENRNVTIKSININVESPPGVDPGSYGRRDGRVLDPMGLAVLIRDYISMLLQGNDQEWFEYGMILFEHVDHVVVSKDGDVLGDFDVAERLRNVDGFPNHLCLEVLRDHKERIWLKRKEKGLKVFTD